MGQKVKEVSRSTLGCPSSRIDVCGRIVMERVRYARLEEELRRTKEEKEKYRFYFLTLLEKMKSSFCRYLIMQSFENSLRQISQVRSVHLFEEEENTMSFYIFLDKENWEAEEQIYKKYGDLLSDFPEFDIQIRLLRLWDRQTRDLLPSGGEKIFGE